MFRALNHGGIAADCLFELFAGGRRMTSEQRTKAIAACAVVAETMRGMRGGG